jgi:hypothetical protein
MHAFRFWLTAPEFPPESGTSAVSPIRSVAESSCELTNASVLTVVLGRKGFLPFSVAEWDASAGSSAWVSPP